MRLSIVGTRKLSVLVILLPFGLTRSLAACDDRSRLTSFVTDDVLGSLNVGECGFETCGFIVVELVDLSLVLVAEDDGSRSW